MTPHQGQGGTQAIEDAEGFRLFLGPKATTSHVPAILEDFDSVRRPRASQIQNNTRMAAARKSAEDIYRFEQFNWNYPGIMVALNPAQGSN
jgi:salicylate hydroxylase